MSDLTGNQAAADRGVGKLKGLARECARTAWVAGSDNGQAFAEGDDLDPASQEEADKAEGALLEAIAALTRGPEGAGAGSVVVPREQGDPRLERAGLRKLIREHGGNFHGPRVEHLSMEERAFWRFLGEVIQIASDAAPPQPAAETPAPGDLGEIATRIEAIHKAVVGYTHQQLGKPAHPGFASAIEIQADFLKDVVRDLRTLIPAPTTPSARAGGLEREAVAAALWRSDHPEKDDPSWEEWLDYVAAGGSRIWLRKDIEACRRRADAILALATAAPDRPPVADLGALNALLACRRCRCPSCDRGTSGENHNHACTHGARCVETPEAWRAWGRRVAQAAREAVRSGTAHTGVEPAAGAGEDGWQPNEVQVRALIQGEAAIEALPVRLRDDLICRGFAVRAWPDDSGLRWRTWLTEPGVRLRLSLASPAPDAHGGQDARGEA